MDSKMKEQAYNIFLDGEWRTYAETRGELSYMVCCYKEKMPDKKITVKWLGKDGTVENIVVL
jgi:hypothetical protein